MDGAHNHTGHVANVPFLNCEECEGALSGGGRDDKTTNGMIVHGSAHQPGKGNIICMLQNHFTGDCEGRAHSHYSSCRLQHCPWGSCVCRDSSKFYKSQTSVCDAREVRDNYRQ